VRRPDFIAHQSRQPTGMLGWIIGSIMSRETAALNDATLTALALAPADRVLEIGFGHGRTIRQAARLAPRGTVAGVDFSDTMLRMAERHCRKLIAEGRVKLQLADSSGLPYPDRDFDKAYSTHTLYFWADPAAQLREIYRVLRSRGRLALGFRPKGEASGAGDFPDSVYRFYTVEDVLGLLREGGFSEATVAGPPDGHGLVVVTARRP